MQVFEQGAAANDTQYLPARHRTLPIPESVTPIANYPTKLRIFKTLASRYWQVRCYLRGKTYTQSLKTTNKSAAISQAKQFFHIKTAELYGEHVVVREDRPVIFNDLVVATLAQQQARVERGELTALSLAILRSRLSKNIQPCFGAMPIDTISITLSVVLNDTSTSSPPQCGHFQEFTLNLKGVEHDTFPNRTEGAA